MLIHSIILPYFVSSVGREEISSRMPSRRWRRNVLGRCSIEVPINRPNRRSALLNNGLWIVQVIVYPYVKAENTQYNKQNLVINIIEAVQLILQINTLVPLRATKNESSRRTQRKRLSIARTLAWGSAAAVDASESGWRSHSRTFSR